MGSVYILICILACMLIFLECVFSLSFSYISNAEFKNAFFHYSLLDRKKIYVFCSLAFTTSSKGFLLLRIMIIVVSIRHSNALHIVAAMTNIYYSFFSSFFWYTLECNIID